MYVSPLRFLKYNSTLKNVFGPLEPTKGSNDVTTVEILIVVEGRDAGLGESICFGFGVDMMVEFPDHISYPQNQPYAGIARAVCDPRMRYVEESHSSWPDEGIRED